MASETEFKTVEIRWTVIEDHYAKVRVPVDFDEDSETLPDDLAKLEDMMDGHTFDGTLNRENIEVDDTEDDPSAPKFTP